MSRRPPVELVALLFFLGVCGGLVVVEMGRRQREREQLDAGSRAFRRLESELDAAEQRADTAERDVQELRRTPRAGPVPAPEPPDEPGEPA